VIAAALTLVLVLTLGGSKGSAAAGTPTTPGNPPAPVTGGASVTSSAPATSGAPVTSAVPVPVAGALDSRGTADRAAALIHQGKANVSGVYACAV